MWGREIKTAVLRDTRALKAATCDRGGHDDDDVEEW